MPTGQHFPQCVLNDHREAAASGSGKLLRFSQKLIMYSNGGSHDSNDNRDDINMSNVEFPDSGLPIHLHPNARGLGFLVGQGSRRHIGDSRAHQFGVDNLMVVVSALDLASHGVAQLQ